MNSQRVSSHPDVILIGGGIMSATLGTLIKQLQPDWSISIFERLDEVGLESSDPWNNAGTGHSALCELNYTPQKPDGSVDISKALGINEQFQVSRQFWSYLAEGGLIEDPDSFIHTVPHISFVNGEKNVEFLRKRWQLLRNEPLFESIEFTTDINELKEWAPLVAEGRNTSEAWAATRVHEGTDVNFGALTRVLFDYLTEHDAQLHLQHEVTNLVRQPNGLWQVRVTDLTTGQKKVQSARFVFIGAGGGSLHLLQKSGIPEGKGLGGFPISGEFLRCTNPAIIEKHHAKVYGQAAVGAPPMSVPHLDTRVIDGEKALLFGPYAGFSPKFLKTGSFLDLPTSVKLNNIVPLLAVAKDNFDLVQYLVGQLVQSSADRIETLREYFPEASADDWELIVAGQRVQVIAKDATKGGVLQFGTEVVTSADGSIGALLGASPGASTAVSIMLKLLEKAFPDDIQKWTPKLQQFIPSYGTKLNDSPEQAAELIAHTSATLQLG